MEKTIAWIVFTTLVSFVGYWGWSFVIGDMAGNFYQIVTENVATTTTTVSLIVEKQKCNAAGGDFEVSGTDIPDPYSLTLDPVLFPNAPQPPALEISCTVNTSKTIFDDTYAN
jgi:hypothetical protein